MSLIRRFLRQRKRNRKPTPIRNKVHFEPLEPRLLLDAQPLTYAMAANTNDLIVQMRNVGGADTLQVVNATDQQVLASKPLAETDAVKITGTAQPDRLKVDLTKFFSKPVTFDGDGESDTVWVEADKDLKLTDAGVTIGAAPESESIHLTGIDNAILTVGVHTASIDASEFSGTVVFDGVRTGLNIKEGKATNIKISGVPEWQELGPGPIKNGQVENLAPDNQVAGAINAVLVNPNNSANMYIGAVNGGLWRTQNATAESPTWTPLTDQFPSLCISSLTFDKADPTYLTLYAGTGKCSNTAVGQAYGLLKTTDGGDNWSLIQNTAFEGDGVTITGIIASGNTLMVAVNSEVNWGDGGLFVSVNGGDRFDRKINWNVTDLVADPEWQPLAAGTPQKPIYAACAGKPSAPALPGSNGVFCSTDGGMTWNDKSGPITALNAQDISEAKRIRLAMSATPDPTTKEHVLYVAVIREIPTVTPLNAAANQWKARDTVLTVSPGVEGYELNDEIEIVEPGDKTHNEKRTIVDFDGANKIKLDKPLDYDHAFRPPDNAFIHKAGTDWRLFNVYRTANGGKNWNPLGKPLDGYGGINPGGQGATNFQLWWTRLMQTSFTLVEIVSLRIRRQLSG